ncbi:lamin tail domain-containing protein [Candidatus Saccharibacteria bacterium]|nr:lamin tail domain-containing protein [Candidatus Saccharibacteria bacterium]
MIIALTFMVLAGFAAAAPAQAASTIRITELNYNPSGAGDKEFVELYNGSDAPVNVSGWNLKGVEFIFPNGTVISAGQYIVVARNKLVLQNANPSARIIGEYPGKLVSRGELIRLVDTAQNSITQVDYRNTGGWPSSPNDGGPSVSLIRPAANETLVACWAPSKTNGGTPGRANDTDSSWVNAYGSGCSDKAYNQTVLQNNASSGSTNNKNGASQAKTATPTPSASASPSPNTEPQNTAQSNDQSASNADTQSEAQVELAKNGNTTKIIALGILLFGFGAVGIIIFYREHSKRRQILKHFHKLHHESTKK